MSEFQSHTFIMNECLRDAVISPFISLTSGVICLTGTSTLLPVSGSNDTGVAIRPIPSRWDGKTVKRGLDENRQPFFEVVRVRRELKETWSAFLKPVDIYSHFGPVVYPDCAVLFPIGSFVLKEVDKTNTLIRSELPQTFVVEGFWFVFL